MTPERRLALLAATPLGTWVLDAPFADPAGEKGDLDPDGRWRTVSGNKIHLTKGGEIDAGCPPALRQVLEEKAGLRAKGGAEGTADAGSGTFPVDYGDMSRQGGGATEHLRNQIVAGLKTINPKFLAGAGTSLRVVRDVSPDLAAKGVTASTRGFADGPDVVLIASNVRSLSDADVAHVVAHEVAHKWERKHGLSTGSEEVMWAQIGDTSRLTPEQKERWKYVAQPGSAEPITEALAQLAHPCERTAWGLPADEFHTAFPRVHALAAKIWSEKGMESV